MEAVDQGGTRSGGKRRPSPTAGDGKRKKRRFVWGDDLHAAFQTAIFDVGLRAATVHAVAGELPAVAPGEHLDAATVEAQLAAFRRQRPAAGGAGSPRPSAGDSADAAAALDALTRGAALAERSVEDALEANDALRQTLAGLRETIERQRQLRAALGGRAATAAPAPATEAPAPATEAPAPATRGARAGDPRRPRRRPTPRPPPRPPPRPTAACGRSPPPPNASSPARRRRRRPPRRCRRSRRSPRGSARPRRRCSHRSRRRRRRRARAARARRRRESKSPRRRHGPPDGAAPRDAPAADEPAHALRGPARARGRAVRPRAGRRPGARAVGDAAAPVPAPRGQLPRHRAPGRRGGRRRALRLPRGLSPGRGVLV